MSSSTSRLKVYARAALLSHTESEASFVGFVVSVYVIQLECFSSLRRDRLRDGFG
jgi:hypothetical protein